MIKKDIIKLGNSVIRRVENIPSLHCEVCGSLKIEHGAIWEDNEENNRIVCEDCHIWLKSIFFPIVVPSSAIFMNALEDY